MWQFSAFMLLISAVGRPTWMEMQISYILVTIDVVFDMDSRDNPVTLFHGKWRHRVIKLYKSTQTTCISFTWFMILFKSFKDLINRRPSSDPTADKKLYIYNGFTWQQCRFVLTEWVNVFKLFKTKGLIYSCRVCPKAFVLKLKTFEMCFYGRKYKMEIICEDICHILIDSVQ